MVFVPVGSALRAPYIRAIIAIIAAANPSSAICLCPPHIPGAPFRQLLRPFAQLPPPLPLLHTAAAPVLFHQAPPGNHAPSPAGPSCPRSPADHPIAIWPYL